MKRGNCVFYALTRWRRNGGYLVVRKSRFGPFPHMFWMQALPDDAVVRNFVPLEPSDRKKPPPYFLGRVLHCDCHTHGKPCKKHPIGDKTDPIR